MLGKLNYSTNNDFGTVSDSAPLTINVILKTVYDRTMQTPVNGSINLKTLCTNSHGDLA